MLGRRRTDRILDAIKDELESHREALNANDSARSVTLVVKLKKGSGEPRTVILTVESEKTLDD